MYSITKRVPLLVLVLVIALGLSACRPPAPPRGVWYCEELMLEINFNSLYEEAGTNSAKKHNADGTYQNANYLLSEFDCHIVVFGDGHEEIYLSGYWRHMFWEKSFTVTALDDEKTYVFKRIDN